MTARWLVRRLALTVLVVLGAATAAFAAVHLAPGDPARTLLGNSAPTPTLLAQVRADMGLDRPLLVQYGLFLGHLLTGDLGRSYQLQEPVSGLIGSQVGATVELAVSAFVLALVPSVLLAVATAGRPAWRRLSSSLELVAISSPPFWTGVLLLSLLSFRLHLFPVAGGDGLAGLVLPSVTLAIGLVGVFTQVLREEVERALTQPFVLSSRARGTGEFTVRMRHALRHAFIPMATLSGWTVGALLSGAVVVETVFNREGLGRITATAITNRDLPVVSGVVVVSAVLFTLINILVDWLYQVVDPRLKGAVR
ncbi:ABC transporter permease [Streptomyces sp. NPDC058000]|uniref:ABC transporter permease n=1 Tax=Streptomyces sp. NPDC058000 TaxID=3346299 RepID=UPI0036E3D9F2